MVEFTRIVSDGVSYQIALPNKDIDYIQGKIAKEQRPYELEMLQSMASRLTEGAMVLDVGANIGNHTLYLAAAKGCSVMSFEPNKALCYALKLSVEKNGWHDRVKVHPVGVGIRHGTARFKDTNQENLGGQSIEIAEDASADIDVIALDDLTIDKSVSAIKIDVEGMELEVLHGAEKLLRGDRPDIYVECQTYDEFMDVSSYIQSLGYVYIETFNATPTHLFVERERVDFYQRGEKLAHKVLNQEYQLKRVLSDTRKKLHQCNVKYRDTGQALTRLKEKLEDSYVQNEEKSERFENRLKEFKCAREKWEMERQQLRQEIEEKDSELQVQEEKSEEIKLAIEKLEASHEEVAKRVEGVMDVNDYSQASHTVLLNHIGTLRDLLSQESRARQEDRNWLMKSNEAAQENLKHEQEKLSRFEREIEADRQYLDSLNHELEASVRINRLLEKDVENIRQELSSVLEKKKKIKQQLEEANQKYRTATANQIPALKEKLEQQTERMRELQSQMEQLNQETKLAKQQRTEALRALSSIKASLAYKAGLHLRSASQSLTDVIKLPVRLWRLRRLAGQKPMLDAGYRHSETSEVPESEAPLAQDQSHDLTRLNIQPLAEKPAKKIRVACVMDDFTFGSYQPECDLYQLTPEHWQAELEASQPELLFIESAWRGKDESWGSKVGHCSAELQGIVGWCRERHIPTVFWNKEDPIHFETFLTTAQLFDFVFTTDIDCIHRYKAALGHEYVYFLPFACQPEVHNPIEKYQRKDAFCFAGAYYVRYPERTKDLESFVQELPTFRPLEIYDRNYGKSDPNYRFPEGYQPHIVGTLPFEEIDKAYKGYRYAINLNSIKQSQTMFARRVYELLGSNTLTVSNFSRGVRLMFGDLVVTSDSGADVRRRLEQLQREGSVDRLRLAGVRKSMQEHTYAERFAYVLSKVSGRERTVPLPSFKVLATANKVPDIERLVAHVERQNGVEVSLSVVLRRGVSMAQAEAVVAKATCRVELLPAKALRRKQLSDLAGGGNWIAGMLPQDYYGPHYLLDIALATRYSESQIIGKAAYHAWQDDRCELSDADEAYRPVNHMMARRAAIALSAAETIRADKWLAGMADWHYEIPGQLAIDAYNYCENGAEGNIKTVAKAVDDLQVNVGTSLEELVELAEAVSPMETSSHDVPSLDGRELVHLLRGKPFTFLKHHEPSEGDGQDGPVKLSRNKALTFKLEGSVLEVGSELPDGKHEYVYAAKEVDCQLFADQLDPAESDTIPLHMEVEPGLNLSLVVIFLDIKKQRIGHVIEQPNRNQRIPLPEGTTFVRLGLRIYAGGSARIKRLLLGHLDLEPANIMGQSDVLLLTNHYPSYDDLYRNGFVHSRVRAYQERGVNVDIFRLRMDQPISWHEFQNVDVTTGSQSALRRMLESGRYRHVLVHFLDPDMWEVLKDFIEDIRVTVWVHGAEIQPWYRRNFNIETPGQEVLTIEKSDKRIAFWKSLLSPLPNNLHIVFVSNIFANEVMEDLGVKLDKTYYSVINNPIDTSIFSYSEKALEQRKKVLSIRPYASRVYANDLSVKAILELKEKPFFDDLEFRIVGEGELFDETVAPLKELKNVVIDKRFLTQQEIADLHKEYGVFLCPSRYDTQGVSRDEAMSSGLVPITNAVGAIPEFVRGNDALMCEREDYIGISKCLSKLYESEEEFKERSRSGAKNVRESRGVDVIVKKELLLFSR